MGLPRRLDLVPLDPVRQRLLRRREVVLELADQAPFGVLRVAVDDAHGPGHVGVGDAAEDLGDRRLLVQPTCPGG